MDNENVIKKMKNLKYFRKVEDFETFKDLWEVNHKYKYYGNRPITNDRCKELIDENFIKDFKRYDLYFTNDNKFIMFDKKITIDNKFYYDDEMDEPENTFKNFFKRNQYNFKYDLIEYKEYEQPFLIQNYCNDVKQVNIISNSYDYDNELNYYKKNNYFIRFLTKDEVSEYNLLVNYYKEIFNDRLEKYYNKYKNKISYIGYWVNR